MDKVIAELYGALKEAVSGCDSNCLALSGGLDSTIIAYLKKDEKPRSIVVIAEDFVATDLTYCQLAAKELGIPLEIKNVTTEEILDGIEHTIQILRNFNDIEIRNSVAMYLAASHAKKTGEKSMITGDGADELFAGYGFFLAMRPDEIRKRQKKILDNMHFPARKIGEGLRVSIESPFLDEKISKIALDIPPEMMVREENGTVWGKWILRKAFEDKIPKNIAWRPKSPMQDGSGTAGLEQLFNSVMSDESFEAKKQDAKKDGVILRSKESAHYYKVFCRVCGALEKSDSAESCPYCGQPVKKDSNFCRMCGAYPV